MINTNILIIEDNPGDARLIQELLKEVSPYYIVKWVGHIKEAEIELNLKKIYEVILLDLNLPDVQGGTTFERINKIAPHIPIIALTGIQNEKLIDDLISKGAQDYLIKGQVTTETLHRSIRYAIERKKVEQRLRNSELRFRDLIEKNPDGMIVVNQNGVVQFVNSAAKKMFNRPNYEMLNFNLGFPLVTNQVTEMNIFRNDNQQMIVEIRVVETFWQEQKAYVVLLHDITNRHQLENNLKQTANQLQQTLEQLKHSQATLVESEKLRALGVMTAGVAHELNNPMTGILQFIEYCIKYTDTNNKTYPVLQDILIETNRCIDIVKNLLTFSRFDTLLKDKERIDIQTIIDRVIRLLAYRIDKEQIQLIIQKEDNIPQIELHASSIQQIMLNIMINAIDALEHVEKKTIHIHINKTNKHIVVEIIDNGCGIDQTIQQHIFDPFFTNKPVGKGTGLGLSISKSMVEQHNGQLVFESTKNKGTTFRLLLPL